jgi:hypothetical protein
VEIAGTVYDKEDQSKRNVVTEGKVLRYSGMLIHEFSEIVTTLLTRNWCWLGSAFTVTKFSTIM